MQPWQEGMQPPVQPPAQRPHHHHRHARHHSRHHHASAAAEAGSEAPAAAQPLLAAQAGAPAPAEQHAQPPAAPPQLPPLAPLTSADAFPAPSPRLRLLSEQAAVAGAGGGMLHDASQASADGWFHGSNTGYGSNGEQAGLPGQGQRRLPCLHFST